MSVYNLKHLNKMTKYNRIILGKANCYVDICKLENFIGLGFIPDIDLSGHLKRWYINTYDKYRDKTRQEQLDENTKTLNERRLKYLMDEADRCQR